MTEGTPLTEPFAIGFPPATDPTPEPPRKERVWLKRVGLVALGALLAAIPLGVVLANTLTERDELAVDLEATEDDLDDVEAENDDLTFTLDDTERNLDETRANLRDAHTDLNNLDAWSLEAARVLDSYELCVNGMLQWVEDMEFLLVTGIDLGNPAQVGSDCGYALADHIILGPP